MAPIDWVFVALSAALVAVTVMYVKARTEIERIKQERDRTQREVAVLAKRLQELEDAGRTDGLLQKAVEGAAELGLPGLILAIAVATSGYYGAAAVTAALAALGPFGMLSGVGVLLLMVPVARAVTKYGLPMVTEKVVKVLVVKGASKKDLQRQGTSIPRWVLSRELRAKVNAALE